MQSKGILLHRLLLPTIILIFVTIYFMEVQGLSDPRDRMLITPIFWIMLASYPLILFQEWKKWKISHSDEHEDAEDNYEVNARFTKKLGYFILSIILYLLFINTLGFVLITLIFLPALMRVLGTKGWKLLGVMPVVVTAIVYLLFVTWLGIPLPKGIFL